MSDKTREVYRDGADVMPLLDPFVEPPRMRVSAINRLNELIERNKPKAVRKYEYETSGIEPSYLCPNCGEPILADVHSYEFCHHCGQRVDKDNIAL